MPYITQKRRAALAEGDHLHSSGELNYVITECINAYLRDTPEGYTRLNDVLGALEGAKLEFYRRVVEPYETRKWLENGDVYDSH